MHKLKAKAGCVMCVVCGEYEYNNNNFARAWRDACGTAAAGGRAKALRRAKEAEKWSVEKMWQLRLGLPLG